MANKPKRRSQRRRINPQTYRAVQFHDSTGLGTLASAIAAVAALTNAATDQVICSSVKAAFTWDDATDQDGPLLVGFAHSDYTVAEVGEWAINLNSMDFGDKISAERSRRLIRLAGVLHAPEKVTLPMKKYKLNWRLGEGDTVNQFIFNAGAALTTGGEMLCMGQANIFLI